MINVHMNSERGNSLHPLRGLLVSNSSKGLLYAFSGKVSHTMAFVTSVVQLWLERDNLNVTLIDDILTPIALPL